MSAASLRPLAWLRVTPLIVGLCLTAGRVAAQPCGSDRDCPGDLVCQAGQCGQSSAPPPAEGSPCKADIDCPGDLVCEGDRCVGPEGAPAPPTAPAGPTPGSSCATDRDCAGGEVCRDMRCVSAREAAPPEVPPPPPPGRDSASGPSPPVAGTGDAEAGPDTPDDEPPFWPIILGWSMFSTIYAITGLVVLVRCEGKCEHDQIGLSWIPVGGGIAAAYSTRDWDYWDETELDRYDDADQQFTGRAAAIGSAVLQVGGLVTAIIGHIVYATASEPADDDGDAGPQSAQLGVPDAVVPLMGPGQVGITAAWFW